MLPAAAAVTMETGPPLDSTTRAVEAVVGAFLVDSSLPGQRGGGTLRRAGSSGTRRLLFVSGVKYGGGAGLLRSGITLLNNPTRL